MSVGGGLEHAIEAPEWPSPHPAVFPRACCRGYEEDASRTSSMRLQPIECATTNDPAWIIRKRWQSFPHNRGGQGRGFMPDKPGAGTPAMVYSSDTTCLILSSPRPGSHGLRPYLCRRRPILRCVFTGSPFDDWLLYSTSSPVAADFTRAGQPGLSSMGPGMSRHVVQEGVLKYFPASRRYHSVYLSGRHRNSA